MLTAGNLAAPPNVTVIKVGGWLGLVTAFLAYMAAFASIGLSVAAWFMSKNKEKVDLDRADRWGIFVGTWAPTFFGLGNALQYYEQK